MASKIAVQNLNLSLPNGASILHDISFEIEAGRITSLIGPSGSGKTSFLRCLNRLWEPPSASIFLDGVDIRAMTQADLRRRRADAEHVFAAPTVPASNTYPWIRSVSPNC